MAQAMPAVAAHALTKTYQGRQGPTPAVTGIDLEIPKGRLFGFLGPNGAGKTTLMRMIHAAFPPTSGTLEVLGTNVQYDPAAIKARLGVAPQENNLDPDFTVLHNLIVYARYFGIRGAAAREKATELLHVVGLDEKAKSGIDELSGGMKRRLILARALLNDPELVVLDEPTTGLDPQSRHLVWEKVRELRRRGTTVLLSTHYMDEAERLCDDLVIVDHGKILQRGAPRDLVQAHASREVLELTFEGPANVHANALRALPGARDARIEFLGDRALVYVDHAETLAGEARGRLSIIESAVRRGSLEDVFLHLTGRGLRE